MIRAWLPMSLTETGDNFTYDDTIEGDPMDYIPTKEEARRLARLRRRKEIDYFWERRRPLSLAQAETISMLPQKFTNMIASA